MHLYASSNSERVNNLNILGNIASEGYARMKNGERQSANDTKEKVIQRKQSEKVYDTSNCSSRKSVAEVINWRYVGKGIYNTGEKHQGTD